MSKHQPTNGDILKLQGRIAALEHICLLTISQFARKPSLRADFARVLRECAGNCPVSTGDTAIFFEGMSNTFKKVADKIVTDELV